MELEYIENLKLQVHAFFPLFKSYVTDLRFLSEADSSELYSQDG